MLRIKSSALAMFLALLFSSSVILVGCSSSPDESQLKQLNDLKEEYAALQKESATKEAEKAALDKEVAEKNAKLKKCNDDQLVVKQRLGK
jgi:septal ring factor EnvC (AmiA/AmiB activator)